METISIRLDENMANEIEKIMRRHHFSTLTEFVRDAIRNRMKDLEHEELKRRIERLAGSSKHKTSDEDLHKARERLEKVYDKKFK